MTRTATQPPRKAIEDTTLAGNTEPAHHHWWLKSLIGDNES
jgi:hypothetical protein